MKKKEVGIAVLCFVILGLIMLLMMVFSIVLSEILRPLDLYSVMSTVIYVIGGTAVGIGAGFGYVIAQRLFDALLTK